MAGRAQGNSHPEDLPWNDAPADSAVAFGAEEPDPAEVEGDEGEEVDLSRPSGLDPGAEYRRDTLSERLAAEEGDRTFHRQAPEAGEFQAPERGGDDVAVQSAEPDPSEPGDARVVAAEDAAVHIRRRERL